VHRFAKQFAILALVIVASLSLAACSESTGGDGGKNIAVAAKVNGKDIPLKDVDQNISSQMAGQQSKLGPLEQASARLQALQGLIQEEVLFQRAEKENLLPKDEEVVGEINSRKLQARMTEDDWQRRLKETGETDQTLRDKIRRELAIRKLIEKSVGKITIRDSEVEEFYNVNKERFEAPRGVGLSAIIVDPRDSAGQYPDDAKSELEAQNKINSVHAQLKTGTVDFADLARTKSEDQSIMRSGDLGFATEDQLKQLRLPAEMMASFFGSMPVGGFTSPIKLEDGRYYIFKLTDRRLQAEKQTLESPGVKDQIKEFLINARQKILSDALGLVALNEAKVENFLAQNMLTDPNMLGGMQPVASTGTAAPAATATPAAATPSPAATAAATSAASPSAETKGTK
jgi:hypothetical protein